MKQIKISNKNIFTIVDDDIFDLIKDNKWCLGAGGYATRSKDNKTVLLHRFITDCPKEMVVDHINGNKLDNRRENLRICTHRQNILNHKVSTKNTSGYTGIYWRKDVKKWRVMLKTKTKLISLGYFNDKEKAIDVYNKFASNYYKEFYYALNR